jgi:UDP-N-acetylmuramyl pentapeptide synthase
MHSSIGDKAGRRVSRVAVLDTIHGANVIAQRLVECGIQAEPLEVYHHTASLDAFDEVVVPVHLPPDNPHLVQAKGLGKRIISHHQAVGELIGSDADDLVKIEVTGTHSKTTTALLLAMILSRQRRVLSHTTRGLEIWSGGRPQLLKEGLSITPANVILAAQEALAQGAEALICEISLGGTGLAQLGILTSFANDYRIAGGTKWASTAKLQMLSLARQGSRLAANADCRISPDISFAEGGLVWALPDGLIYGEERLGLSLGEDLDFASYRTAISGAAAAAELLGLEREDTIRALEGFGGFSGRMKIERLDGRTVFDSSNSGLKVSDIERALDKARGPNLVAVVGEDAQTVCEGLDIPRLVELLRRRRSEIEDLVLVGERLRPLARELGAETAKDLVEGLEKAESSRPKRLLSAVKCFR